MKSLTELVTEVLLTQSSQRVMSNDEIRDLLTETFRTMRQLQLSERGVSVEESKEEKQPPLASEQPTSTRQIQPPTPEQEAQLPVPVVSRELAELRKNPMDSILKDKIICLECGEEFKQLSHKHLAIHGQSQETYREQYGFSKKQPLAAYSVTEARKKRVLDSGLADKMKNARRAKREGSSEQTPAAAEQG